MKTGVLCFHGFTGGPYEVQPFVDFLEVNTDWKIIVPTFLAMGKHWNLKR